MESFWRLRAYVGCASAGAAEERREDGLESVGWHKKSGRNFSVEGRRKKWRKRKIIGGVTILSTFWIVDLVLTFWVSGAHTRDAMDVYR